VFWGISFVATKAALKELSPSTLIFTRFAMGTALLAGMVLWKGSSPLPPRNAFWPLVLTGFIGIFVHQLLQAYALRLTTAVHTGWLIGLIPIWSALISAGLRKERFGWMKVTGLIGGFAGALLVISRGKLDNELLQLPSTRGDFLILLSTINWAIYSNIGLPTLKELGSTRSTAGTMLFGWLMLTPVFVLQQGWHEWSGISLGTWGAVFFLGIGCSGLGYLFWYGALEKIEVSKVAAFLYIEPLVTLVAAMALLHEPVTVTTVLGGLVVLASVFIIQRAPS
jgi:drug/metabolite transporter (DMT)-like permease